MKLEPLFEGELIYDEEPQTRVWPYGDGRVFAYTPVHGRIQGQRLTGRLRAHNLYENIRRRKPRLYRPHFRGAIDTDDGAVLLFDAAGYNQFEGDLGTIVMHTTFQTSDKRYRWLNETIAVVESFSMEIDVGGSTRERWPLRAFTLVHDLAPEWNPPRDGAGGP